MELPPELLKDSPDARTARAELLALFRTSNGGTSASVDPVGNEKEAFCSWLASNYESLVDGYFRRVGVLMQVVAPTLSSKVNSLSQLYCHVCGDRPQSIGSARILIRIKPVSQQAMRQRPGRLVAFRRAIADRLERTSFKVAPANAVCLQLVFVVKRDRYQKDLDNMAKALLDATKNVLYGDDRMVDHLNIFRVVTAEEEFAIVNIRQSFMNENQDVICNEMRLDWAGAEAIDLDEFVSKE